MLKIGDRIPSLQFNVFHNNDIYETSLDNFRGKWLILFFYPADFTFVCPTELESLSKKYEDFKKHNAEILTVSKDSAFVHKAWVENKLALSNINFPMAGDIKGELCKAFNTLSEEDGLSYRATFIINPEGIIKSMEINDSSIGRNTEELVRKLQAAIFVSKNKGKVCPINWTPDKNALNLPEFSIFKGD